MTFFWGINFLKTTGHLQFGSHGSIVLVKVILCTKNGKQNFKSNSFLIFCSCWVGTVCMNPARAFGPAVITGEEGWNRHWLFWVSDLTGAVLSSGFYM